MPLTHVHPTCVPLSPCPSVLTVPYLCPSVMLGHAGLHPEVGDRAAHYGRWSCPASQGWIRGRCDAGGQQGGVRGRRAEQRSAGRGRCGVDTADASATWRRWTHAAEPGESLGVTVFGEADADADVAAASGLTF